MAETISRPRRWLVLRRIGGATGLFAILTAIMTWPQVLVLSTHALDDPDVFFNLWRLRWIAHALESRASLFDANIFHPERGVLAYSDALLVEGVLGAPLLHAGVPPVLVHNLLLLGALVASGVGMFVLARHLTGSTGGAIAAGVIFAFAPYRFAHYMHLELQWVLWSPWAFWALQRTIESGSFRFGLLTGLFLAPSDGFERVLRHLLVRAHTRCRSAAVDPAPRPATSCEPPGLSRSGSRSRQRARGCIHVRIPRLRHASAHVRDSRSGCSVRGRETIVSQRPPTSCMAPHGRPAPNGSCSRDCFLFFLALAGLLLVRPTIPTIGYVIGLIVAFELSLGVYGRLYPFLYNTSTFSRASAHRPGPRYSSCSSSGCSLPPGSLHSHHRSARELDTPLRRWCASGSFSNTESMRSRWCLTTTSLLVFTHTSRAGPGESFSSCRYPQPGQRSTTKRGSTTCRRFTGCRW